MTPKTSAQILVALSLAYGITIGILGALESTALTTVAIAGALVLGALWAIRGMIARS